MSRSTLSFTVVQFLCFDISSRTIWKFAAFRRGYYPIQAITARHSLSPDSFILCAFTVPCGPTSLQWREHKGLTMFRSSDTQSVRIPSLFRREFWHHVAGELNTATDPFAFWLGCISLFHRSLDDGTYDDSLTLILLISPLPLAQLRLWVTGFRALLAPISLLTVDAGKVRDFFAWGPRAVRLGDEIQSS